VSDQKQFSRIELENGVFETKLTTKYAQRKPFERYDPRIIKAVIPGVVAEIGSKVGQPVQRGDTILIVEAMKMRNRIMAPRDGTLKAIHVSTGMKVAKGQILIEFE
jgi:biotin carboxyl carrier protein